LGFIAGRNAEQIEQQLRIATLAAQFVFGLLKQLVLAKLPRAGVLFAGKVAGDALQQVKGLPDRRVTPSNKRVGLL
jgi:hypothetical protein